MRRISSNGTETMLHLHVRLHAGELRPCVANLAGGPFLFLSPWRVGVVPTAGPPDGAAGRNVLLARGGDMDQCHQIILHPIRDQNSSRDPHLLI
ncbi:unnamed protein product [Caenorhabditis brenneri]